MGDSKWINRNLEEYKKKKNKNLEEKRINRKSFGWNSGMSIENKYLNHHVHRYTKIKC